MMYLVMEKENNIIDGLYPTLKEAGMRVRELSKDNPWETWRIFELTERRLDTLRYIQGFRG